MGDDIKKSQFWRTFLRAVEVDPREPRDIRGASGLIHPVVSLGIDENRRRLVIISGESDPRSAALAQADIQTATPGVKVIMARPVAVNLGQAAKILSEVIGSTQIGPEQFLWFKQLKQDELEEKSNKIAEEVVRQALLVLLGLLSPLQFASLSIVAAVKEMIQQLALVDLELKQVEVASTESTVNPTQTYPMIRFQPLIALDPAEMDRRMGVCPVPLYDFQTEEVDLFHSGTDVEQARDILGRHHILQYFFPAPDHLALGVAEAKTLSVDAILDRLRASPEVGHPFGAVEILPGGLDLTEIVDALQDRGLVVEGEAGIELTPEGRTVRASVRFKPREGLLAKLAHIISVKADISLKDLLKGS